MVNRKRKTEGRGKPRSTYMQLMKQVKEKVRIVVSQEVKHIAKTKNRGDCSTDKDVALKLI